MLDEQKILTKLLKPISQSVEITITQLTKSLLNNKTISEDNYYRDVIKSSVRVLVEKCVQPQLNNFVLEKGNNTNLYPVFGIVAWKDILVKENIVNWQLCSWVESGGVRCVNINQVSLNEEKNRVLVKQQLSNIHALIIPSTTNNNYPSPNALCFLHTLLELIKQSPHSHLNILALGRSGQLILNTSYPKLFIKHSQITPKYPYMMMLKKTHLLNLSSSKLMVEGKLISIQQKGLFSDIDVGIQMNAMLKEIVYTGEGLCSVDWTVLTQCSDTLQAQSFILTKPHKDPSSSYQLLPYFFKQQFTKNVTIYHSLLQPTNILNQSIFNKVMVNFVNQTKKTQHKINNPKTYIGHYPLEFKDTPDKAYYKITTIK